MSIFEFIEARPLKVRQGKKAPWIKSHGQRVNLACRNHYSSLESGRSYYFSDDGQRVKQLKNYV